MVEDKVNLSRQKDHEIGFHKDDHEKTKKAL